MSAILEVAGVTVRFGGVTAVDDVSFSVEAGEFLGLIGPNGAGKTTLLRVVTGVVRPQAGRIAIAGHDATALTTAARVRLGLGLSHQIVRPFRTMTVVENVMVAAGFERMANPLRAFFARDREGEKARALELLKIQGCWGLGADSNDGEDLFEPPDKLWTGDLVVVLGAEGRGLRPGIANKLDHRVRIPMAGGVDSLNVSVAGSLLLFERMSRIR